MYKSNQRQALIAKIHIAKHQLNIDEITYRQMLMEAVKKNSCKVMTVPELTRVLHHLEQRGFKARRGRAGKFYSPSSSNAKVNSNIALKIRAIWIEMYKQGIIREGSEQALNAFVRNIINPLRAKAGSNLLVFSVASLKDAEATLVLERLKKWQGRYNNG
ncbi:phage gp16-like protein [Volucribacter psittacicida]|uniref:Phage gp16-like protein n=1 Tax=Volucribacter psittacicida TaxID=203482 RepID=A0A4R1FTS2_9PAST|nr:regulatory protein GemA [Volucribacter psittacicida]TCJ95938.1 phage gp16-like protein [Volucribacter psittacicida]